MNAITLDSLCGIVTSNSTAYVRAVLDAFRNGVTVVPLRQASDAKQIKPLSIQQTLQPALEWGWDEVGFVPTDSNNVAQVMFTSGTEGLAKGVLLSHANLNDVTVRLNAVMNVDSSIREYIGVPVYHSFGFGRCRAVAAAGGRYFIPQHGFNPLEISTLLKRGELNAVSAVPSLWRVLLKNRDVLGSECAKMKWIEIGSQYMSKGEKEELRRLFPNSVIVQHYGLTEASRSTFLEIHSASSDVLESVGKPTGRTEVKLSPEGRIMIRGPHVALGYLVDGIQVPLVDADGWFTTNDLGALNGGFLTYNGRADDIINCGGIKLNPDILESRILSALGVNSGIVVCRIPDLSRGDGILVSRTPDVPANNESIHATTVAVVSDLGISGAGAVKVWEIASFPTTNSGKVRRGALSDAYIATAQALDQASAKSGNLLRSKAYAPPTSAAEKDLVAIWEDVLGIDPIGIDDSFIELGGDSLSAINLMIRMETHGVNEEVCKNIFQGLTIRQIVNFDADRALADRKDCSRSNFLSSPRAQTNLMVNGVRSVLVLAVILAHWTGGVFERIPENFRSIQSFLYPIFSFGTPGFSVVFGVSAGYVFYPRFLRSERSLQGVIRTGMLLVGSGIVILAVIRTLQHLLEGAHLDSTAVLNNFYSVLCYYFLAIPSLFVIFRLVRSSGRHYALACVIGLAFCYGIHTLLHLQFAHLNTQGAMEFVKLIFTAKYAYFNMLCGTLMGLVIGIYLHHNYEDRNLAQRFAAIAGVLITAGLTISFVAGDFHLWLTPSDRIQLWKWLVYGGVVMLLSAGFRKLVSGYEAMANSSREALHLLGALGQLALPLFVSHELVIPLKRLLVALGISAPLALTTALSLFGVFSWFALRKVYRLHYG